MVVVHTVLKERTTKKAFFFWDVRYSRESRLHEVPEFLPFLHDKVLRSSVNTSDI